MIKLKDILSEIKVSLPYPPKTIGWWLVKLDEPYRTQAINNWKNSDLYNQYKDHKFSNIHNAVNYAFAWITSPEGGTYWSDLYNKYDDI